MSRGNRGAVSRSRWAQTPSAASVPSTSRLGASRQAPCSLPRSLHARPGRWPTRGGLCTPRGLAPFDFGGCFTCHQEETERPSAQAPGRAERRHGREAASVPAGTAGPVPALTPGPKARAARQKQEKQDKKLPQPFHRQLGPSLTPRSQDHFLTLLPPASGNIWTIPGAGVPQEARDAESDRSLYHHGAEAQRGQAARLLSRSGRRPRAANQPPASRTSQGVFVSPCDWRPPQPQ